MTWHLVYLLFLFVMFGFRIPRARQYNRISRKISHQNAVDKILQFLFGVGTTLLPVVFIFSERLHFANYQLPEGAELIGLVLLILAVWFFHASHRDLGKNWSPSLEVREEHTLVTKGIYSKIRHPMYVSAWLWNLAVPFLLHNWLVSGFAIFGVGLLYFIRVPKEESMMVVEFGEQYLYYQKQTGRLFPKL